MISHFPLVSIIILNLNGKGFVERCLKSVLNSKYPNFEVIFVDNASTDESFELVRALFGLDRRLKIIRNNENLGFPGGNNIGIRHAKGDHLVFLNNDTEVDEGWLNGLIEVMESDSGIGAAQGKLLRIGEVHTIDSAGQFIDRLGYGYPREGEDTGQYNSIEEIFYADGACLAIRRPLIEQVLLCGTPFDEDYFPIYYEDADICWRIRLRGYKVVFIPTSIIFHARSATKLSEIPSRLIFSHVRNRIMTLMKNYDLANLMKYLPKLLVFETIRAIVLLNRKPNHSLAILKAVLWNFKHLKDVWKKRLIVQQRIRAIDDTSLIKCMMKPSFIHLYHNFKKHY